MPRGGKRAGAGRKRKVVKNEEELIDELNITDKSNVGRPSEFRDEFVEQADKLCRLGATDADLANFFNVSTVTIWRWAVKFSKFCNALKAGKEACDERVVRSLYHRAVGYTHEAVKIFQVSGEPLIVPYKEHVAPDTTAAIFWLKNRRSEDWMTSYRPEGDDRDRAIVVRGGLPDPEPTPPADAEDS